MRRYFKSENEISCCLANLSRLGYCSLCFNFIQPADVKIINWRQQPRKVLKGKEFRGVMFTSQPHLENFVGREGLVQLEVVRYIEGFLCITQINIIFNVSSRLLFVTLRNERRAT